MNVRQCLRLSQQMDWIKSATDKELKDELIDLSYERDDIIVQLDSPRSKDAFWYNKARRASTAKRNQIKLIESEIHRRKSTDKLSTKQKKIEENMRLFREKYEKKLNNIQERHRNQVEALKSKLFKRQQTINEDSIIIRELRRLVGDEKFFEICSRASAEEVSK